MGGIDFDGAPLIQWQREDFTVTKHPQRTYEEDCNTLIREELDDKIKLDIWQRIMITPGGTNSWLGLVASMGGQHVTNSW